MNLVKYILAAKKADKMPSRNKNILFIKNFQQLVKKLYKIFTLSKAKLVKRLEG